MGESRSWEERDARDWIAVPEEGDDKYSRGVLGVEAAARTGVGMVRYLGAERPTEHVLRRRPEVVSAPGRVQAWLIGSGMDASSRPADDAGRLAVALGDGTPLVIDAGALDLIGKAAGPVVITPHYRELAGVLAAAADDDSDAVTVDDVRSDPAGWAARAAVALGVTVLLKGHTTHVVTPDGAHRTVSAGPAWLATAGSGDVLGGVLGALVATHADAVREHGHAALAALAATAAWLHGRAGEAASAGGPIAALDIAEAVPSVIRRILGA